MSATNDQIDSGPKKDDNIPSDQISISNGIAQEDNIDDLILRANGHKAEMRRQFNWFSALSLGLSITNTWIGYFSVFGQTLKYGGPRMALIGLVIAFCIQFVISIGLAEIGSAFPSSGGQYHFCLILSPEKTKRFSGYVVGWMSVVAWWIVSCSGISLAAITLAGMISFFDPTFAATQWQVYLLYVGTAVVTAIPVFLAAKKLAWFIQVALMAPIIGVFMTLFLVVGFHKQTQPASFLYDLGSQATGWNVGTAWMLGICNCMYAFGATDGALHISEEMLDPGRRVPQVIILTLVVGLVTTLPLFAALLTFVKDLDAVTNSTLPSMEIIYQATGNRAVTVFIMSWMLLVYMTALPSQWVTSGRIAWAFARDNGVPFSSYFSKISTRLEFPVRTTIAAMVFVAIYGLLYLASTTAFNSIVTSATLFLNITYAVPQGILLFRGRDSILPSRWLKLGYFGIFCNTFSIVWIVILGVFVCMPPAIPVTVESMNYISVVSVGIFSIIILFWFISGRKNFEVPDIDWDLLNEANSSDIPDKTGEKN